MKSDLTQVSGKSGPNPALLCVITKNDRFWPIAELMDPQISADLSSAFGRKAEIVLVTNAYGMGRSKAWSPLSRLLGTRNFFSRKLWFRAITGLE
jgi:hypothetical protein